MFSYYTVQYGTATINRLQIERLIFFYPFRAKSFFYFVYIPHLDIVLDKKLNIVYYKHGPQLRWYKEKYQVPQTMEIRNNSEKTPKNQSYQ